MFAVLLVVAVVMIAFQVADMRVGSSDSSVPQIKAADLSLVKVIIGVMLVAGAVGLAIAVSFLAKYSDSLRTAPPPGVSSKILIRAFLVYLVANLVLGGVAVASVSLSGLDDAGEVGNLVYLVLQSLAILTAFALGLGSLAIQTGYSKECLRRIGLRLVSFKTALKWGVGGYLAALPFFGVAVLAAQYLDKTVFRAIKIPEHPLVSYLTGDGGASFVLVFVLGAIIAPLVEETFFRGFLYSMLRDGLGVWAAAVFSAVIFAVGHPLPTFFLPIFVLGVVFALMREKTGSVIPSMVAHCIHNTTTMILARLLY